MNPLRRCPASPHFALTAAIRPPGFRMPLREVPGGHLILKLKGETK